MFYLTMHSTHFIYGYMSTKAGPSIVMQYLYTVKLIITTLVSL